MRAGGDPQAQIQQELEEHEALQHRNDNASSQTKPASFEVGRQPDLAVSHLATVCAKTRSVCARPNRKRTLPRRR